MPYKFPEIDKKSSVSFYEQLYNGIISAIKMQTIVKGEKLPSIRCMAEELGISRTTVETAYEQLCAEGYIKNSPRRGFFVEAEFLSFEIDKNRAAAQNNKEPAVSVSKKELPIYVKYDFSSSAIDPEYIDLKFWKRCVKEILDNNAVISSYGSPQGEPELREVLCRYSNEIRGVCTSEEKILIGAGTQTLLSVLMGMLSEYGHDIAIEKGFFPQGEQIFFDFGFKITPLKADKNGIILDDSVKSRILFINSSGSIRGSAPVPINKRMEIIRWAEQNNAIIIEDDFNGELRYNSRPVPALQGMCSERVVYIGSFSKLLLPSVRISYMVMPEHLAQIYAKRQHNYNQTASRVEQLALAEYIRSGRLERQLRRLRKVYSIKSKLLSDCLDRSFGDSAVIDVIETALCVRIKLKSDYTLEELISKAKEKGIYLGRCRKKNGIKYFYLSFSGLPIEMISPAASYLASVWK